MRKLLTLLVATLVITTIFTAPVQAAGGRGKKAVDVCWMSGGTEVKAKFQMTSSGIVHEFRYEPNDVHGVFKPVSRFPNEPDEGEWFLWTAHAYMPCEGETDMVTDFLEAGMQYWVQLEVQY